MKNLVLSLFFISITSFIYAQDSSNNFEIGSEVVTQKAKWQKSFEKAQKLAKKKNKPLLVFFTGSDWCGPCKNLHKDFFDTEKFIKITKSDFILYEADFPRRTDIVTPEKKKVNRKIQTKYGVRGYPTILILNSKGTEIGRRVGYSFLRDPEPHFQLLIDTVKLNE